MIRKLHIQEDLVQKLLNFPESGMGYQVVEVVLKNGKVLKNRTVLNSEYLILTDSEEINQEDIKDIKVA